MSVSVGPTMRVYTSYYFLHIKNERSHLFKLENPAVNNTLTITLDSREAACKLHSAPKLTERSFPGAAWHA